MLKKWLLAAGAVVVTLVIFSHLSLSFEKSSEISLTSVGNWDWHGNNSSSTSGPLLDLPANQVTELNYKWNHLQALQNEDIWSPTYSENGKFKLVRSPLPMPDGDDKVDLSIYDSLNNLIFKGIVGGDVIMSNDGVHFVSRFFTGGGFFFHSISEIPPKFDRVTGEHYYSFAFSSDGRYFVGAGDQRIDLYSSDGTLLWSKFTNAAGPKKVSISDDGSIIVMGTMSTSLGDGAVPVVGDRRIRDNRWTGKGDAVFVTALDRSGHVLSQVSLEHPVILEMEQSAGTGEYAAVSCYNFLTVIDTRAGKVKWKQTFSKPWGKITSIAFSKDNRLLAVAGTSDGNTNAANRLAYLVDSEGSKEDSVIIADHYRTSTLGPAIGFSEDGSYVLIGGPTKKQLFQINLQRRR